MSLDLVQSQLQFINSWQKGYFNAVKSPIISASWYVGGGSFSDELINVNVDYVYNNGFAYLVSEL